MGYDILILTDHRKHTSENSVYALAAALVGHTSINAVDIASRGIPENEIFFEGEMEAVLSVFPALPRLTYARALKLIETSSTESELVDYDFVLLRLPHPLPVKLFRALPEAIPEDHIINEPSGITRTSSKAFLLEVADLCPPMQIVKKQADVKHFLSLYPEIVLKPMFSYAGQGIIKMTSEYVEDGNRIRTFHRPFFKQWQPPYLAMQFLKNVTEGDKRTIVINGQILGSAIRKPAPGHWICNVAQGGEAIHAIADETEIQIASRLSEQMHKHGITIFGFDTLVDDHGIRRLSEINTMSIGGLRQIRNAKHEPIMKSIVQELVKHMDGVWFGKE